MTSQLAGKVVKLPCGCWYEKVNDRTRGDFSSPKNGETLRGGICSRHNPGVAYLEYHSTGSDKFLGAFVRHYVEGGDKRYEELESKVPIPVEKRI